MGIGVIIVFIIIGIFIYAIQRATHEDKINKQIEALGGTIEWIFK